MSTQISLKLSDKMFGSAKKYAERHGFDSLQDFLREIVREKLFEKEEALTGLQTVKASEASLGRNWQKKKEAKAWEHLQKGTS